MYAEGDAVEADPLRAYVWLSLAARGLDDTAAQTAAIARRDSLATRLGAADRDRAEQEIDQWRPHGSGAILETKMPDESWQAVAGGAGATATEFLLSHQPPGLPRPSDAMERRQIGLSVI